jgi:hypothetical protein
MDKEDGIGVTAPMHGGDHRTFKSEIQTKGNSTCHVATFSAASYP